MADQGRVTDDGGESGGISRNIDFIKARWRDTHADCVRAEGYLDDQLTALLQRTKERRAGAELIDRPVA